MIVFIFLKKVFLLRILQNFFKWKKMPKFHHNKYLDMYINTFDGYESSTQSTPLEVVLWYCIKLKYIFLDKQSENQGNSITPDQDQVQFSESELNQCLINIYLDFSKISNESLNNLLQHVVFPSLSTLTNSAKQSFTDR